MKINKVLSSSTTFNVESTINKTIGRGRINGLLFVNEQPQDFYISVKLRGSQKGITVIANRITFQMIETITNYKYGYSARRLVDPTRKLAYMIDIESSGIDAPDIEHLKTIDPISFAYLDLGFINFNNKDLEIDVEKITPDSGVKTNTLSIYTVHSEDQPEIYKTYNILNDLEGRYSNVREMYLYLKDGLISDQFNRIHGQLDFRNEGTYLFDEKSIFAASHLFTNAAGIYESNLFQIYTESNPLPSSPFVKIDPIDGMDCQLLVIGEVALVNEISDSTVNNAKRIIDDIVELEKKDPSTAKAYRHSGVIPKSAELKEIVQEVENSKKEDDE